MSIREKSLGYFALMIGAAAAMPESTRRELSAWEATGQATSLWPGWRALIGEAPWTEASIQPKRARQPIPGHIRKAVFERDAYRCVVCGSWEDLTLDHIHPHSLGGPDTIENLQTMCRSHNSSKGARQ